MQKNTLVSGIVLQKKMPLLQENVYFSSRKVNKNAYFCPCKMNKNVILVIFNMSTITCGSSFKPFYFSTRWVEPFLSLSGVFCCCVGCFSLLFSLSNR